jgi:hypothetical protein
VKYYVYAYLREDNTPFYIGKGQDTRIDRKHRFTIPPRNRRRILCYFEQEQDAFEHEMFLISFYGRKDLGTGILRNMTDGGEGASGYKHTDEAKEVIGDAKRGEKNHNYGKSLSTDTRNRISQKKIGKTHTAETRNKMSESRSGEKNHNYGKSLSTDTRNRISKSLTGENGWWYGKTHKEDTIDRMKTSWVVRRAKKYEDLHFSILHLNPYR